MTKFSAKDVGTQDKGLNSIKSETNALHKVTKGEWFVEMSDLTIRSKSWGESDCMGDYKGNIIADLKPSLGITEDDVISNKCLSSDGIYSEVLANALFICNSVNHSRKLKVSPPIIQWIPINTNNLPSGNVLVTCLTKGRDSFSKRSVAELKIDSVYGVFAEGESFMFHDPTHYIEINDPNI